MALTDFFRINLPYGLKKNDNNEWFCFNREYVPLGWNSKEEQKNIHSANPYSSMPVYTKYKGLTENRILNIIKESSAIQRGQDNTINRIFFYNDSTNPTNSPQYWNDYFEKIKQFSKFKIS